MMFFRIAVAQSVAKGSSHVCFTIVILSESFQMVSQVTQMEIICKIYTPMKLTYQLTTSRPTKLLVFHLLG